jgi:hypothetical protein
MLQTTPLRTGHLTAVLEERTRLQLKLWGIKNLGTPLPVWLSELIKAMKAGFKDGLPLTYDEFLSIRSNNDPDWSGPPIKARCTDYRELMDPCYSGKRKGPAAGCD